ncbi:hypothetical protein [Bacillus sp. JJ1521]|uniref:hypothetical protein n=1 Tax=Bacillus sp. JJ1521 TaxID=3122957 RepID=UPI003F68AB8E
MIRNVDRNNPIIIFVHGGPRSSEIPYVSDNMDFYTRFLTSPKYNELDVIRFLMGISATQEILLAEEKENDIPAVVRSLDIHLYFVMGKYEYMTSTNSAKAF